MITKFRRGLAFVLHFLAEMVDVEAEDITATEEALKRLAVCRCGHKFWVMLEEGLLLDYTDKIKCPACGKKRATLA